MDSKETSTGQRIFDQSIVHKRSILWYDRVVACLCSSDERLDVVNIVQKTIFNQIGSASVKGQKSLIRKRMILMEGGYSSATLKDLIRFCVVNVKSVQLLFPPHSAKTSKCLKLKNKGKLVRYSPTLSLLNEDRIAKAIWECLKDNDPEGIVEVIEAYLEAMNKVKFSRSSDVPRSTLYHCLKSKNPTIKTLAKLVHGFMA